MKRMRTIGGAAAVGALAAGLVATAPGAGAVHPTGADAGYAFDLGELNDSGVTGTATVTASGDELTVTLAASGLAPDLPHAMHIHGTDSGSSVCPPASADTNGDGLVDTAEGVPFYGGIEASLTTSGDTSPDSALAVDRFPTAPDGTIEYSRTFEVDSELVESLDDYHIVVHGIDLDGSGAYDGEARSSLTDDLPLEATIPAACGEAEAAEVTQISGPLGALNGSGVTGAYTATLVGTRLEMTLQAEGLVPNLPHAMHLHGSVDQRGVCPPPSADENGDGLVSTPEGVPFYGGIQASLTTSGDTSPASALAIDRFPTAADGTIEYSRVFEVPSSVAGALVRFHVVVHGVDLNGSGAYDGATPSPLDPALPLEATLPAACGEPLVVPAGAAWTGAFETLNDSGVTGRTQVIRRGDMVTVSVTATGLAPNLPHAMHLHGTDEGPSVCPPASADTNDDGLVDTAEGVPFYGGIEASLTTSGDTSPDSALAVDRFPTAPDGSIAYSRTFTLDDESLEDLGRYHVVVHGIDLDGSGAYDGEARSSLTDDLPLEATIPAACAETAFVDNDSLWLVGADGGVFALGEAMFAGSLGGSPPASAVVDVATTPTGAGYLFIGADGTVTAFGDAMAMGDADVDGDVAGLALTPTGMGYYAVSNTGDVAAVGDAEAMGGVTNLTLNAPIVDIAPTPTGDGYWLVAADGGIFAFGDASFFGSAAELPLNQPVIGMVSSPTGDGYLLFAADGGVFAYGDATFVGSTGGIAGAVDAPAVDVVPTTTGYGYWVVTADGMVYGFGDAEQVGSVAGLALNAPIVGASVG